MNQIMSLRSEVLRVFKLLHRSKNKIFNGDHEMIKIMRHEINDNFRKNKMLTDPEKINELLEDALLAEKELRTTIIQVVETAPGCYKAKLTADHCISEDQRKFDIKIKTKK